MKKKEMTKSRERKDDNTKLLSLMERYKMRQDAFIAELTKKTLGIVTLTTLSTCTESTQASHPEDAPLIEKTNTPTPQKRNPSKVYIKFDEIPEITAEEAALYKPEEYTYIINAEKYQKTGEVELKRVLKDEVTKANLCSVIYRREGPELTPSPENGDQAVHYEIKPDLRSKSGGFMGPTQMGDGMRGYAIAYMAIDPKTKKYAKKYFSSQQLALADEMTKKFFDENGEIKKPVNATDLTQSLMKIKPKTNTANYFNALAHNVPEKDFIRAIETTTITLGEYSGNITQTTNKIAQKNGKPANQSTRLPLWLLSGVLSSVNCSGNGGIAKQAATITPKNNSVDTYSSLAGRSAHGLKGMKELAELNYLTEDIINQYAQIGLTGSKDLYEQYTAKIAEEEQKISRTESNTMLKELSAIDFVKMQQRSRT